MTLEMALHFKSYHNIHILYLGNTFTAHDSILCKIQTQNVVLHAHQRYFLPLSTFVNMQRKRDCKGHAFGINDGIFPRRMSYTYSDSIKKLQPQNNKFVGLQISCRNTIEVYLQY